VIRGELVEFRALLCEALDINCVTGECVFVISGVGDFLCLGLFFCGHKIFFVSGLMFLPLFLVFVCNWRTGIVFTF